MPVTDQNNQMAMLQQAIQQMQAQQQLQPLMQKLMSQPQQAPSPMGGQGLGAMMGGHGAMGAPPSPQTLGVGQPIPMQMPPADPTGQQQQPPLPPDPTAMGQ